jgi:hypothetical protein
MHQIQTQQSCTTRRTHQTGWRDQLQATCQTHQTKRHSSCAGHTGQAGQIEQNHQICQTHQRIGIGRYARALASHSAYVSGSWVQRSPQLQGQPWRHVGRFSRACTQHATLKKKGVTRVAHAATLQLNPAMEGYSQYEKGNHQDKPHP